MGRSTASRIVASGVAGVALVVGQVVLGRHGPTWLVLPFLGVGVAMLTMTFTGGRDPMDRPVVGVSGLVDGPGQPLLAAAGVANCIYAAGAAYHRPPTSATYDIAVAWAVGLALFVAAGCAGRSPRRLVGRTLQSVAHVVRGRRRPGWPTVAGLAVTAVALVARLVALDRFPVLFDSDESFYLIDARLARHGDLPNPYGSTLWGIHRLYLAAQGIVSRPFPDTYGSYRILGAVLGAATVGFTWRAGRRIVGEWAALASAAVLALMPFHLWASRSSLNNSLNSLSLSLILLFSARLVEGRRRADALGLGLALGTALFGYFPALTFPLLVIGALGATALVTRLSSRDRSAVVSGFHRSVVSTAPLVAWVAGGWFVGAAPFIGYFAGAPDELLGRTRTVMGETGTPTLSARLGWVPDGVLFPLSPLTGRPEGHFFRHPGPFVGWAVSLLILVGICTWGAWVVAGARGRDPRRRVELLVVPWLMLGVAVSQSKGIASQRVVGATVLWALAAGSGVVGLVSLARWILGPARAARFQPALASLAVAGLLAIGLGGAKHWFDDDRQLTTYGDPRSAAAFDLGERLPRRDRTVVRVLLAGEGTLSYKGFGNFRFLAPGLEATVLEVPPFEPGAADPVGVPDLQPGDVLVLHSERPEAERCAVLARYPRARAQEARTRSGELMYTAYRLDGSGLPEGFTRSGSVLDPVAGPPCA